MREAETILSHFDAQGRFVRISPLGAGHINDTYLITTRDDDPYDYVLQRINASVFKNVPELQDNIERVTSHIRKKLEAVPGADPDREVLTLVRTLDGLTHYYGPDGTFWRVFFYIDGTKTYDVVDSPAKAYEGGRAFGRFLAMLADLPGEPLHETIPRFHDIDYRLGNFREALKNDPACRAKDVRREIDFVEARAEEMRTIRQLGADGEIPVRITHNDTKFNNVLLDQNGRALCVTDLDTVMNGYVHFDFGDAIRTSTGTGAEDEVDLNKVEMDIRLFEAYARGYLRETKRLLNPVEVETLAFSAHLMTFIIGLRFFTDYLDGDHYFKVHREGPNLQRARAQFKLLRSMEAQYEIMRALVAKAKREA
jgi:hypothetical protein